MAASMPTGERRLARPLPAHRHRRRRGFTYLWLLFVVAAGATGLAALGQRATAAIQRERETELVFRGLQIQSAIAAYWQVSPGAGKELPRSLVDLLEDRRGPAIRRHLRQLYTDPFTGKPDWALILTEDGRIRGVHSRSRIAAMRTVDFAASDQAKAPRVGDRQFVFMGEAPPAAAKPAARNRTGVNPGLAAKPATQPSTQPVAEDDGQP